VADIFVTYTNSDRDWAFWIGQELQKLGHTPHIHEWEISAGGNIAAWMEQRHQDADHILCVISKVYLAKPYSSWERQAAQWAAADKRPNFALPVFIEDCEAPTLLAPLKRCDLFGLSEDEARKRLAGYLAPAAKPAGPVRFPGVFEAGRPPLHSLGPVTFPGGEASPSFSGATPQAAPSPQPKPVPERARGHLVILVHGIRDIARWQSEIRDTLEKHGFLVELTNYDRMNLLEFLLPFPFVYFRTIAKNIVWKQIRHAQSLHPGSKVSIIAHSFGTYIISELLRSEFDIRFYRVVFCGSVVSYTFPFEQFGNRYNDYILNEVGTADPWPAVAESVTTGYGSAGTYGFRRPGVRDRFHNGAGHGFFLRSEFCEKFWVLYLSSGTIEKGSKQPWYQPYWVILISIFKQKYFIAFLFSLFFMARLSAI
jgi:TIR domain